MVYKFIKIIINISINIIINLKININININIKKLKYLSIGIKNCLYLFRLTISHTSYTHLLTQCPRMKIYFPTN